MTQQEILLQITALRDKASAASMECVKYMGKEGCTQKYLAALREHTTLTKEINRLKKLVSLEKVEQTS